mgnify:CR=1 FL=1
MEKDRKVQIGNNVSLLFDVVKHQIQDGSTLQATMLIEYPDDVIRKKELSQLIGIEHKAWLQIGENDRIFANTNEVLERTAEEKTSKVDFLLFELSNLMVKDLKAGATLFAGIDHPNYNVRTQEIQKKISDSLTQDLA